MTHSPDIVGDNTNVAEAEAAIAHNAQVVTEAAVAQSVAEAEVKNLESDDGSTVPGEKAPSTELGLVADVVAEATGMGAASSLLGFVTQRADDHSESADVVKAEKKMGGMIGGGTKTSFDRMIDSPVKGASLPERFNIARGALQEHAETTSGMKANEASIATLKTTCEMQMSAQVVSKLHLGNAVQKKAELGGQQLQAQQAGLTPGGNTPQLALNQRVPKGPTTDIVEETGTA